MHPAPCALTSAQPFARGREPILRPRHFAVLVFAGLFAACTRSGGPPPAPEFPRAETYVDYDVEVVGAPTAEIEDLVTRSLQLTQRQGDGAQSLAFLRRRGEGDTDAALRVLRSFGHYGATVRVEVIAPEARAAAETAAAAAAGQGAAAPTAASGEAPAPLSARPGPGADAQRPAAAPAPAPAPAPAEAPEAEPGRALARMILDPGPLYTLAVHRFQVSAPEGGPELPPLDPRDFGSPVGGPAQAGPILDAERRAVARLRDRGRPWARGEGRRAVADPVEATLEVDSRIAAGPYALFGPIQFEGLEHVEADHLLTYQSWKPGEEGGFVVVSALRDYQRELMQTELFSTVSVNTPEDPPEGGPEPGVVTAPVIVRVQEAPRRSIAAGVRWNSDTGPAVRGSFTHRNLWGRAERLDAWLEAGLTEQVLRFEGRKPQYLRDGQNLVLGAEFRRQDTDAYDELGATFTGGLERELSRKWTIGAGGLLEIAQVTQSGVDSDVLLVGLPAFIAYDSTDDPLDRTRGQRARLNATPFVSTIDGDQAPFLTLEATGATYHRLDDAGLYVVALRGRLGTIVSDSLSDIPPQRRFYAGGGGSVRGYAQDFVGPLDNRNDPTGGRSVAETSLEFRARVWGDLGGVAFVDAGAVSEDTWPEFDDGVQAAAGLGVRYFTPIGPIRLDVAVPIDKRRVDDAFQFYFSVGQAF